jgi:hypothetical protein
VPIFGAAAAAYARDMIRSSVLTIALAALAVPAVAPAAATRQCGLAPRIDGVRYDVKEVRGTVGCATVKHVVAKFLRDGTASDPWFCTRGHGSSPYAASCARGERVLVRVYAPT